MTKVCGDLVGRIARSLKQNGKWEVELLDESKTPIFPIRLVAETLDRSFVSAARDAQTPNYLWAKKQRSGLLRRAADVLMVC
jgi:hypothetical protein